MLGGATLGAAGVIGLIAVGVSWPTAPLSVLLLLAFLVVVGASTALGGVILRVIWAVDQKQKARLEAAAELRAAGGRESSPKTRIDPDAIPAAAAGSAH